MKITMISIVLALLAGCAVVPIGPYDAYGPVYPSAYYAAPAYGYYGSGYYRPGYYGYYGPRSRGYYGRGGYGSRGGYGHYR
jgi:hypothetical protein